MIHFPRTPNLGPESMDPDAAQRSLEKSSRLVGCLREGREKQTQRPRGSDVDTKCICRNSAWEPWSATRSNRRTSQDHPETSRVPFLQVTNNNAGIEPHLSARQIAVSDIIDSKNTRTIPTALWAFSCRKQPVNRSHSYCTLRRPSSSYGCNR